MGKDLPIPRPVLTLAKTGVAAAELVGGEVNTITDLLGWVCDWLPNVQFDFGSTGKSAVQFHPKIERATHDEIVELGKCKDYLVDYVVEGIVKIPYAYQPIKSWSEIKSPDGVTRHRYMTIYMARAICKQTGCNAPDTEIQLRNATTWLGQRVYSECKMCCQEAPWRGEQKIKRGIIERMNFCLQKMQSASEGGSSFLIGDPAVED